ncbi:exopolygalacturonase-like [Salvia hispanica]|uniref:exopolygalacturonase-like n=1 Tax=Salvia hispanica TaxID=49212 RepID=UPI0020098553|nr:exopolygalacturonase-like [Salvia hispanica]
MDSNSLSQCIVIFFLLSIWSTLHVHCKSNIFTVSQSKAKTDIKQALLDAWKKACAINGGTIRVAKGNYQLSDVEFLGPCNGKTRFQLNGNLIAPAVPTPNLDHWIMFRDMNQLTIHGRGTLDGNGASYWKTTHSTTISSLKLEHVNKVNIRNIHSINSKKFHFNVHNCNSVTIKNIRATAPADSPNTDGIHIRKSNNIRIIGATIATGDDCISIGDGVTNMNITGVNCGPGHGISIGSLGKYHGEEDVRSIRVTNCNFKNTENGLRIKTFGPSPPGLVSDITFEGNVVNNVGNPIIIDQHYCPESNCGGGGGDSSVAINGVKFIDVRGSSGAATGVKVDCSRSHPCKGIELRGVSLTFNGKPTNAVCSSADVKFLGGNQTPSRCS